MKNVLQILGVFFIGALIGFMLMGFGLSVDVSMIPLLAWIARNAPAHLKATFFAVFASFTNLALSASSLFTKYLNQIYEVTREVKDKITNEILSVADYSELGILLIVITLLTLLVPIFSVIIIQRTRLKTNE